MSADTYLHPVSKARARTERPFSANHGAPSKDCGGVQLHPVSKARPRSERPPSANHGVASKDCGGVQLHPVSKAQPRSEQPLAANHGAASKDCGGVPLHPVSKARARSERPLSANHGATSQDCGEAQFQPTSKAQSKTQQLAAGKRSNSLPDGKLPKRTKLDEARQRRPLYPSVYISDVPAYHTDDDIGELHQELNIGKLVSVKFLPSKFRGSTKSAILRYEDDDAAKRAVHVLRGHPVSTSCGVTKYLGARIATPAQWMLNEGLVPTEDEQPQEQWGEEENVGKYQLNSCLAFQEYEDVHRSKLTFNWESQDEALHSDGDDEHAGRPKPLLPRPPSQAPPGHLLAAATPRLSAFPPSAAAQQPSAVPCSASVRCEGMPNEYTEDDIRKLHKGLGLDESSIVAVSLLQRRNGLSRSCILNYVDDAAARQAMDALGGHPVSLGIRGRAIRYLEARLDGPGQTDADSMENAVYHDGHIDDPEQAVAFAEQEQPHKDNEPWADHQDLHSKSSVNDSSFTKFASSQRVKKLLTGKLLPSVYLSDVPSDYTEHDLRDLHSALNLDERSLVSAKFLPAKTKDGSTCSCILRYESDAAAQMAIEMMAGYEVSTSSGAIKFLGAKIAAPAQWMVDEGLVQT